MAQNQHFSAESYTLTVAATHPAVPDSGDPVVFGNLPGVALTDEDAAGNITMQYRGTFRLAVEAVGNSGNSAVVAGDKLYYDRNATIKLNKRTSSGSPVLDTVPFGIALAGVGSGDDAVIPVLLTSGA